MCAPTARNAASKRPAFIASRMLVTLRVELQSTPRSRMRLTSASSTSRGRRYFGMPKRIMPPATGPGLVDLDRVPEAREMVGRRQAGGPGAHDQHALAGRRGGGSKFQPRRIASSPRKRSTELMPTARIQLAAVAGRFAGVVADAAHDGGQRVVLRQQPPGLPRSRRTRRGRASPGCSRRRGRRGCTAAAGRRTPGARCARCRCGWRGSSPGRA